MQISKADSQRFLRACIAECELEALNSLINSVRSAVATDNADSPYEILTDALGMLREIIADSDNYSLAEILAQLEDVLDVLADCGEKLKDRAPLENLLRSE